MTQIRFEKIKREHLPQVLDIYTYYVLNTTATFHIDPPSIDQMASMVIFDDPKYQTFVILEEGKVCGYVSLTQFKNRGAYDRTAEVTVYLQPYCTGEGICTLALQYIEKYALTRDIHVLMAIICGENSLSINAFSRNGYSKCGHYREVGQKFGQWLDIVAYQKVIP